MDTVLIINPGSSSKKYALYKEGSPVMVLRFEKTGIGFSVCSELKGTKSLCEEVTASEFENAIEIVFKSALEERHIKEVNEIEKIGLRVVAPATYFTEHRVIDEEYEKKLEELLPVAPLHIPQMLSEIRSINQALPETTFIGVSDTAFHTTADPIAKATSLPTEDVERFDLHSFGYHGISVASIVKHIEVYAGSVPERMVVCHIGSGVSLTAVKDGKSLKNSMGYSPASGTMMSSRMGDLPADMLAAVVVRKSLKGDKVFEYLFKEGGFQGMVGVQDLRLVFDRASKNDLDAEKALNMFAYQIRKVIAEYAMLMDGIDTIVLTATAMERNPTVRSLLVGKLPLLNTYINEDNNETLLKGEGYIQSDESDTKILVLKTDELGEMYRIVSEFKV